MSDAPENTSPAAPSNPAWPDVQFRPLRTPGASMIWALPILAVLIGVWLVVQSMWNQGPTVTVTFKTAEGLEAGKTKIRYKDVDVGQVREIALSKDRKNVLVKAELIPSAANMLASDTRFYVVRPRISAGSISGLGTLISGAYIGMDVGTASEQVREFAGLEDPPLVLAEASGREFVLQGSQLGSLDVGSPVFFRHVKVGHVTQYALTPDGNEVIVRLFINAPHDRYVSTHSRFWHASGIDMSFDSGGLRVLTQSLVSVIEGGVAFETPPDRQHAAPAAPSGATFTLFERRELAMRPADNHISTYVMYFSESLRGLSAGAAVDLRGIVIGEVKSLGVEYGTTQALRFPVEINIYPDRLRSRLREDVPHSLQDEGERGLFDRLLASGLRGQLRPGNLLTGQLYIALDFFPDAPRLAMDWSQDLPVLPTVAGGLTEIQETIGRVAKRIDRVPIDEIAKQLSQALVRLDQALHSSEKLLKRLDAELAPEATAAMREARSTLEVAQGVMRSTDATLQHDVRDTLRQVTRSARSLAALTELLERNPDAIVFGKKAKELP